MKWFYKLLLVLLLSPAFHAFAQPSNLYDLNTTLDNISRQMEKERNSNFMIVQAYKDGLVKEGEPFSFMYQAGKVSLNNRELTGYEQQKYSQMYKNYLGKGRENGMYSYETGGLKLEEILNPASGFRKSTAVSYKQITKHNARGNRVIKVIKREMERDGLMTSPDSYSIEYNSEGVFLNGLTPPSDLYAKYERLCIAYLGHKPASENDGFSYSSGK